MLYLPTQEYAQYRHRAHQIRARAFANTLARIVAGLRPTAKGPRLAARPQPC